jgi:L,D-transpeptidase YcbB
MPEIRRRWTPLQRQLMSSQRPVTSTFVLWLLLAVVSSPDPSAASRTPAQVPGVASALQDIVNSAVGLSSTKLTAAEHHELVALYGAGGDALWVDGSGRPGRNAQDAIVLLNAAANDGLDPGDYDVGGMAILAARLRDRSPAAASDIARFDVAVSLNTLRYLAHLHLGRVDPRALKFHVPNREPHDFAGPLRAAIAQQQIPALVDRFAPSIPLYRHLRAALTRYRALAADAALQPFALPEVTVRPGDPCSSAPELSRLLEALGDLPAGDSVDTVVPVYEGRVVEGVKRFQLRHGLEADGVLGKATRAALTVPLWRRVRQIELALERLRWVPDIGNDKVLVVNIPMFRVWGIQSSTTAFSTEVIVGRALNTRTPVLVEEMEYVIFRPYWNIPSSIVRHEIMPAVRRNPAYLQRNNMEIVDGQSDDARVVPATVANLERAQQGALRIRQRPGSDNALGLVKFVFPNAANVYMHGTPAPALFSRPRRDFSHGCIRVADVTGLTRWVLSDVPGWTQDRILDAMNGQEPLRVNLPRSIRVILFYITAVVTPDDGRVHFVEDIYGHDARLNAYLRLGGES